MSQRDLMLEAIRRLDQFHANEDPRTAWSGLGNRSTYKPVLDAGLMEWASEPAPRCMGWLRLTEDGVAEVDRIRDETTGWTKALEPVSTPNCLPTPISNWLTETSYDI